MKRLGSLFYLVDPRETLFSNVDQIPAYITEAIPYFVGLIFIEQVIAFIQNKSLLKVNDTITSAGQGLLMEQSKYVLHSFYYRLFNINYFHVNRILLPGFSIIYYKYIHDNFRIIDLPSNSYLTWILALLLIDFIFYWFHRACHGKEGKVIFPKFLKFLYRS